MVIDWLIGGYLLLCFLHVDSRDGNFRYFGRYIVEISDIDGHGSEICNRKSVNGKIEEISVLSAIYCRYIGHRTERSKMFRS